MPREVVVAYAVVDFPNSTYVAEADVEETWKLANCNVLVDTGLKRAHGVVVANVNE